MSDLISRQDALDATWFEPSYTDPLNVLTEVRDRLKALPSAQPEIIHCKECKFYTEMRRDLDTGICRLSCHHLGRDGFCSEAELKPCKV